MITAVDSSVILDVLVGEPPHGDAALAALREARELGRLVACPVVWAEVRAFFPSREPMHDTFGAARIEFDPFDAESALLAGESWKRYRAQGGSRARVVADFLIAAHALSRADRLLTRDRGFGRRYFRGLSIVEP